MSAFRRRTVFAAPLIISLAGCGKDDGRTSNPPGMTAFVKRWTVRRAGPGACAAQLLVAPCPANAICASPPPPQDSECPPGTSGKTEIEVVQLANGSCKIRPGSCGEPSCATVPAPCPLPEGQKLPPHLVEVWVVEKDKTGGDGCHAEEPERTCPPGVDCNPPVPRKVACPPGVTETEEVRVGLLPDKTCAVLPDGCHAPACAGVKTPCP